MKARQLVITPVQRITPDSDGTRQKNAGRLISCEHPKSSRTADVAGSNAAQLKWQSRTRKSEKKHPADVIRSCRGLFAEFLDDFLPHPSSQQKTGRGWLSLPYGRDGQRMAKTTLTLGLGVLSLWVVPYAKHELAGHQGMGESPPCAAVRRSKLNSFLLAKQGYPRPIPFPIWPGYGTHIRRAASIQ